MTGSCDIFSVCLNEKFDYKIYKKKKKKEVHYFCFSEIDKIKYYIDVRGFTNSFNEFVNFYRMPKNGEIKKVSKSEINETKRQKYYLDGERFAKKIINENINNYFINKNIEQFLLQLWRIIIEIGVSKEKLVSFRLNLLLIHDTYTNNSKFINDKANEFIKKYKDFSKNDSNEFINQLMEYAKMSFSFNMLEVGIVQMYHLFEQFIKIYYDISLEKDKYFKDVNEEANNFHYDIEKKSIL